MSGMLWLPVAQQPALSLKQKFMRLCDLKKPTGDPSMPLLVRLAKQINTEIHNSIAVESWIPTQRAHRKSCHQTS